MAKGFAVSERIQSGKEMLVRIVAMLTKLVERFDPYPHRVRESAPDVAGPFELEDDDEHETIDQGSKALLGQILAGNRNLIDSSTVVTVVLSISLTVDGTSDTSFEMYFLGYSVPTVRSARGISAFSIGAVAFRSTKFSSGSPST